MIYQKRKFCKRQLKVEKRVKILRLVGGYLEFRSYFVVYKWWIREKVDKLILIVNVEKCRLICPFQDINDEIINK